MEYRLEFLVDDILESLAECGVGFLVDRGLGLITLRSLVVSFLLLLLKIQSI